MSWFESVSPKTASSDSAKPIFDTAAMAQLGAMSPLWMLFISASTAGMAYWGMTRWMRLAAPEQIVENVVKLRLVKPEPAPKPVVASPAPAPKLKVAVPEPVAIEPIVVEPAVIEPVVAEIASVSVVMPEPVATVAAAVAPDLVTTTPKPKVAKVVKPKPLKTVAPQIVAPAPVVAKLPVAEKIPARRGRPPKAVSLKVEAPKVDIKAAPAAKPAVKAKTPRVKTVAKSPTAALTVKAPGAKRGPKPKPKI